jgi:hypothetical protein
MQRLGIARPEFVQQMGPLAQQLGMRGEGVPETVANLLGIQRITGIQGGQMAGLVGAAGVAGRAATQPEASAMIVEAMASGLETGIRKQKLGEYMSEITSHVQSLRRQGILIEPRSIGAFVAGVSKYGTRFKGEAGVQAAGNILAALRGAGERNDFGAMLVMQTAMEQGRDPYEAMEALEDPEQMREILPAIVERIQRMSGGQAGKALALSQVMQGRLSKAQAREMISGQVSVAAFADVEATKAIEYIKEQERVTESSRGVARQEAALRNKQLGVGAGVYGPVKRVEEAELGLAAEIAPPAAAAGEFVAGQMKKGLGVWRDIKAATEGKRVPEAREVSKLMLEDFKSLGEDILEVLRSIARFFTGGGPPKTNIPRQYTHRGMTPPATPGEETGETVTFEAGQTE